MERVAEGPLLEAGLLSAGLDYYKPTMSQLAHEQEPDAEVTFTLKNRGVQRLLDYVDPNDLAQRFADIRGRGWQASELDYLGGLRNIRDQTVFKTEYITYLQDNPLPPVELTIDSESNDLAITTTGPWALSTFWETVVMSEINEAYFEGYVRAHNLDPFDVYDEGNRRLDAKIAVLQANPDIKFADFGTRRHFSLRWQQHVIERLLAETPDSIVGTSNVALANKYSIKPIGTFAHELPMTYAGAADARGERVRDSHPRMLNDWYTRYGEDLSVALTDTFGSDYFFDSFMGEQARDWRGVRHDSGDPVAFGERLIAFYQARGIDPTTKIIVFSDGLDIDQILRLHDHFKGRINHLFGWGTTLTNDLGIKPLSIVMKATHVRLVDGREANQVKLSDNPEKHTGPEALVRQYQKEFGRLAIAA
jgi:nicotinate phosphoribosyltransferase